MPAYFRDVALFPRSCSVHLPGRLFLLLFSGAMPVLAVSNVSECHFFSGVRVRFPQLRLGVLANADCACIRIRALPILYKLALLRFDQYECAWRFAKDVSLPWVNLMAGCRSHSLFGD
eukprot:IDg15021t1